MKKNSDNAAMTRNVKPWTTEEERLLKERAGKSTLTEVGEELGRSKNSVKWKTSSMGLLYRKNLWSKEMDKRLIEMLKEYKYDIGDFSREFGKSESAVYAHIYRLGIRLRPVRRKWGSKPKTQGDLL
ncbi:MAG: hypothetical protein LUD81_02880 [Clostridiales bacterium]|nr:hypothetical protein [Clostridiales bacterium]